MRARKKQILIISFDHDRKPKAMLHYPWPSFSCFDPVAYRFLAAH
jgi:hypothetical protein